MPDQILGAGLDRQVDAERMRLEEERRGPAVVRDDQRAVRLREPDERRNIVHVERVGARHLDVQRTRVRTECGCDGRAAVVPGRLDAEPREHAFARMAHRAVDRRGHQQVIAGLQARQQRERARGQTRRTKHRAGAAFEARHRALERIGRRRAAAAVDIRLRAVQQIGHRRAEHGRRVVDGRIDEAVPGRAVAARVHEPCVVVHPVVDSIVDSGLQGAARLRRMCGGLQGHSAHRSQR